MKVYLGIDVGSVTTKVALIDEKGQYVDSYMTRTSGQPVIAVQKCLDNLISQSNGTEYEILSVGTTGSGRNLAGALVGADVIKNEITAHAVAASSAIPDVQTILEIGGQDSKIIILRDGIVTDFAMNTVCAAGTGSGVTPVFAGKGGVRWPILRATSLRWAMQASRLPRGCRLKSTRAICFA